MAKKVLRRWLGLAFMFLVTLQGLLPSSSFGSIAVLPLLFGKASLARLELDIGSPCALTQLGSA